MEKLIPNLLILIIVTTCSHEEINERKPRKIEVRVETVNLNNVR